MYLSLSLFFYFYFFYWVPGLYSDFSINKITSTWNDFLKISPSDFQSLFSGLHLNEIITGIKYSLEETDFILEKKYDDKDYRMLYIDMYRKVDNYDNFDYIIKNDGTIEDLKVKVNNILEGINHES